MKKLQNDKMLPVDEASTLLKFLKEKLSTFPAGKVKSFLEHRQVMVDGVITTQFNMPLQPGQTVTVLPDGSGALKSPLEILYEDKYLVAINKPTGLLSVPDDEKSKNAYQLLKQSRQTPLFIVHRIDRDTSGVLLFAKSKEIADALQENWGERTILREYKAICEGLLEQKKGTCKSRLKENSTHRVYSGRGGDGKPAVTNYEVLSENSQYSLLRVWIETGRKNQIRVHLSELGHPIVGDKKYGAQKNPIGRLGLHASALHIKHPVTGKDLLIKAKAGRRFALPKGM